jgi:hypothetical protein
MTACRWNGSETARKPESSTKTGVALQIIQAAFQPNYEMPEALFSRKEKLLYQPQKMDKV